MSIAGRNQAIGVEKADLAKLGRVTVEQFGASASASAAVNVAAFQAAIDFVFALGGGVVNCAAAQYSLGSSAGTVTLPHDTGSLTSAAAPYGASLSAETAETMPYALDLKQGVRLVGQNRLGTKLLGNWTYGVSAVDLTQIIGIKLGSTQAENVVDAAIENIRFENFLIPFMVRGVAVQFALKHLTIQNCGFAGLVQTAERCHYDNIRIVDTPAGIVHGGWWNCRENTYTSTSIPDLYCQGWTDKCKTAGIDYQNSRARTSFEDAIDAFFDTHFFKTVNSTTGAGYTSAPTADASAGAGTGATFSVQRDAGTKRLTGVTVLTPGSGYTANFAVTFTGGGGTGAAATAIVSGGAVVGVAIGRATCAIPGDAQSGFINTCMYRGVTGVAVTHHSRYGRPNFTNSQDDWFVYGAYRMPFNGGRPYYGSFGSWYCERVGFYDPANYGAGKIMGVDYVDPYFATRPPAGIYGVSGNLNKMRCIYFDPCALVTPLDTGGQSWEMLDFNHTYVTTPQQFQSFMRGEYRLQNSGNADPSTFDYYLESANLIDANSGLTVEGATTPGTCTYSLRRLQSTRSGNVITFAIRITYTGHNGVGAMVVRGLPYPVSTGGGGLQVVKIASESGVPFTGMLIAEVSGSQVSVRQTSTAGLSSDVSVPAAADFYISGSYLAA